MIRFSMVLLVLILFGAAAGRYKAEVAVRELKQEIEALEEVKSEAQSDIKLLRAEVAYLEGPERLASIAPMATTLKPLSGNQLMTADEFLLAFQDDEEGAHYGRSDDKVLSKPVDIAGLAIQPIQ